MKAQRVLDSNRSMLFHKSEKRPDDFQDIGLRITDITLGDLPVAAIEHYRVGDGVPHFSVYWQSEISPTRFVEQVNRIFRPSDNTKMVVQTWAGGLDETLSMEDGIKRVRRGNDDNMPIFLSVDSGGFSVQWSAKTNETRTSKGSESIKNEESTNGAVHINASITIESPSDLPMDGRLVFSSDRQHLLQIGALWAVTSKLPLPNEILTEALREYPN